MATFDHDDYTRLWLITALADELALGGQVHLMDQAMEPEGEPTEAGPAQGFIVRDWFGPFLLAPVSRSLRGRC